MSTPSSAGARFRDALAKERPLQIPGVINAYYAMLAARAGFQALYLSGAGVANASRGLPDIGITQLEDVLIDTRRITARVPLPLLVDIDTGWDDPERTVRALGEAGAAAVHLEDQIEAKRCGHLEGKRLVGTEEMVQRVRAACRGRIDSQFVVMARTDAVAVEGLAAAIQRARAYVAAGADMVFAEAVTSLDDFRAFTRAVNAPVLANLTEFGRTPLFRPADLASAGIAMVLYPLSAFRAAAAAAARVYSAVRTDGTQEAVVNTMQTRRELYEVLGYTPGSAFQSTASAAADRSSAVPSEPSAR